jgi:hypothetical protein
MRHDLCWNLKAYCNCVVVIRLGNEVGGVLLGHLAFTLQDGLENIIRINCMFVILLIFVTVSW